MECWREDKKSVGSCRISRECQEMVSTADLMSQRRQDGVFSHASHHGDTTVTGIRPHEGTQRRLPSSQHLLTRYSIRSNAASSTQPSTQPPNGWVTKCSASAYAVRRSQHITLAESPRSKTSSRYIQASRRLMTSRRTGWSTCRLRRAEGRERRRRRRVLLVSCAVDTGSKVGVD